MCAHQKVRERWEREKRRQANKKRAKHIYSLNEQRKYFNWFFFLAGSELKRNMDTLTRLKISLRPYYLQVSHIKKKMCISNASCPFQQNDLTRRPKFWQNAMKRRFHWIWRVCRQTTVSLPYIYSFVTLRWMAKMPLQSITHTHKFSQHTHTRRKQQRKTLWICSIPFAKTN